MKNRCGKTRCAHALGAVLLAIAMMVPVSWNRGIAEAKLPKVEISDPAIVQRLEWDLIIYDAVKSNSIDVSCTAGVVTLSGFVGNLLAKERMVEMAQRLKGVRAVIDLVEVRPVYRTDEEIRRDVEKAIFDDPATDSYEIQVAVRGGIVTLKGIVDSWQERMLSVQVVKGVRGVRDVLDEMEVRHPKNRRDGEIRSDIERTIGSDIWVYAPPIIVAVEKGAVRLTGTVGSVAEKSRAVSDAWVAGVRSVDAEDLNVHPPLQLSSHRIEPPSSLSDTDVADAVKSALLFDPRVEAGTVDLTVRQAVVILEGNVENLASQLAAEAAATNTVGVRRVRNLLKVRPALQLADDELAKKVREALKRNPYLEFFEVFVSVFDGTVYLFGDVDSEFERREADRVVTQVSGVVEIVNLIRVEPAWRTSSDWEIQDDVESKLIWNASIDQDDINVRVEDAVVTLTGTVDRVSEKMAAGRSALAAGAKRVQNNLVVKDGTDGP